MPLHPLGVKIITLFSNSQRCHHFFHCRRKLRYGKVSPALKTIPALLMMKVSQEMASKKPMLSQMRTNWITRREGSSEWVSQISFWTADSELIKTFSSVLNDGDDFFQPDVVKKMSELVKAKVACNEKQKREKLTRWVQTEQGMW
jgi:hypothetical protein